MECNVQVVSEEDFPPLPVTPSKPPIAKKTTISHVGLGSALNSDDAVCTLINLINSRSDKIEKMVESDCVEIKDLNEKFITIENRVERSEETTTECVNRVSELERYGRRWNLRLYGVSEVEKENVRAEVINVCQQVLPEESEAS